MFSQNNQVYLLNGSLANTFTQTDKLFINYLFYRSDDINLYIVITFYSLLQPFTALSVAFISSPNDMKTKTSLFVE